MYVHILHCQEAVGDTLEELWISYNSIEKLKGITMLGKLKVGESSNEHYTLLAADNVQVYDYWPSSASVPPFFFSLPPSLPLWTVIMT